MYRLDVPAVTTLYQNRLVLVRPDGHVAWRADTEPAGRQRAHRRGARRKVRANLDQRDGDTVPATQRAVRGAPP